MKILQEAIKAFVSKEIDLDKVRNDSYWHCEDGEIDYAEVSHRIGATISTSSTSVKILNDMDGENIEFTAGKYTLKYDAYIYLDSSSKIIKIQFLNEKRVMDLNDEQKFYDQVHPYEIEAIKGVVNDVRRQFDKTHEIMQGEYYELPDKVCNDFNLRMKSILK